MVNPAGYICPMDGGNPRIVTGIAATDISGGELVYASGAADAISSGLNSFTTSDIAILNTASGALFNGVALYNQSSGNAIAVATAGIVAIAAGGAVTAGYPVCSYGDGVVTLATDGGDDMKIGRAWSSTSTSGAYVLVELTP